MNNRGRSHKTFLGVKSLDQNSLEQMSLDQKLLEQKSLEQKSSEEMLQRHFEFLLFLK